MGVGEMGVGEMGIIRWDDLARADLVSAPRLSGEKAKMVVLFCVFICCTEVRGIGLMAFIMAGSWTARR